MNTMGDGVATVKPTKVGDGVATTAGDGEALGEVTLAAAAADGEALGEVTELYGSRFHLDRTRCALYGFRFHLDRTHRAVTTKRPFKAVVAIGVLVCADTLLLGNCSGKGSLDKLSVS